MSQRVRPQVLEYVHVALEGANTNLTLDRLPEDPLTLALLVAIALQVKASRTSRRLLEAAGVPEMMALEGRLLTRELLLLQYMIDTREMCETLNSGPSGYIFPN
jgi:hypothetical protein